MKGNRQSRPQLEQFCLTMHIFACKPKPHINNPSNRLGGHTLLFALLPNVATLHKPHSSVFTLLFFLIGMWEQAAERCWLGTSKALDFTIKTLHITNSSLLSPSYLQELYCLMGSSFLTSLGLSFLCLHHCCAFDHSL